MFSKQSWEQFSSGDFERVPLIIGFVSNELGAIAQYIGRRFYKKRMFNFKLLFSGITRHILAQYDFDVSRLAPYGLTQNWFKRFAAGVKIKRHYFGVSSLLASIKALAKV